MARQARFEYAGACYHVMARGDGGKMIFEGKEDAESFLYWLSALHESHGSIVHAWVLMGNHFHLLLETPSANLVSGMRYLMSHFSQGWNARRKRRGHVFQGRYKAIPISGERVADGSYFRITADYIHLNPARAKLAGGKKGDLVEYPWSSLKHYKAGKVPPWMKIERVLDAFSLDQKRRGRTAYVEYLEIRAKKEKGELDAEAMRALRRGWFLGEDRFRDQLLNLMDQVTSKAKNKKSIAGAAINEHNEQEAESIIAKMSKKLKLIDQLNEWEKLRRNDPRKIIIAAMIRYKTTMTNQWLAERLQLGDSTSVSRFVNSFLRSKEAAKMKQLYEEITRCKD
jgi:REP element-mobilizing transposase RayT